MRLFKNHSPSSLLFFCFFLIQIIVSPLKAEELKIQTCQAPSLDTSKEEPLNSASWGSTLIYALPFVLAYTNAWLSPFESKIKPDAPWTLGKMGYIAASGLFNWASSISLRAFFRPHSDLTEEAAKNLNAATKKIFEEKIDAQVTDVSLANLLFSNTANSMNAKYSIRSQMARANIDRALLYVLPNIHQAREEMMSSQDKTAAYLIADAMLYLRKAYAEIQPANLEVSEIVKNNLGRAVSLPDNFSMLVEEALKSLDIHFEMPDAQAYYKTISAAWGISNSVEKIESSLTSPFVELAPSKQIESTGWFSYAFEMTIKYIPGLALSLALEVAEASPIGQAQVGLVNLKKLIKTCKLPFVTALSDPLNKYLESILQKWTFEKKNTGNILSEGKVRDLSRSLDGIQENTYNHYTQNAQNGRANLARPIAMVADYATAARRVVENHNEALAASLIANAASLLRIWHNEIDPENEFVSRSVQVRLSLHTTLSSGFQEKVLEHLAQIDGDFTSPTAQEYYQKLLRSWKITSAN